MYIRGLAAIAAGLVLVLGVTGAIAHRAEAPTALVLVDFADSNGDTFSDYIIGTVSSPKRKCEGGRTVKIVRRFPASGEPKVINSARTSANGYWAGGGVEGINSVEGKVAVLRKVRGSLVCKAVSENFD
jgi:hypothetical protein